MFCNIIVLFNAYYIINRVDSNEVFKHAYLGLKTASGCQTYVVGPGHGTPGCACRGSLLLVALKVVQCQKEFDP